jgi:excisionase family DNA binding protein
VSHVSPELETIVRKAIVLTLQQLPSERIAYTIEQAAEAVGLPRSTLRDRVSSGELPARKRCGKYLILRSDLLKWLQD